MKKLYFPIGISGSGKSTYIKKHFDPKIVVSPDDLRRKLTGDVSDHSKEGKVWATVPILLQYNLDKYGEAVLDATNVDSGNRADMLKKFKRDEVERIAIVFKASPEVSKSRIKKDLDSGKDRSNVPDDIVDKQQEKFLRGYNTIKQQFDKVIFADKGEESMSNVKQEDIKKLKKIVLEEMQKIKEEDSKEAMERAEYQAYQDMYLTPQSNWKLKKNTNMYDESGKIYTGNIGEVHKIRTVEYDFMHTGEVVTECGGKTYSLSAEDFRECFEMVNDEEGLKISNESVSIREDIKRLSKIKDYFGKNIRESIERLEQKLLPEAIEDLPEPEARKKLVKILNQAKIDLKRMNSREEHIYQDILEKYGVIKTGDENKLRMDDIIDMYYELDDLLGELGHNPSYEEPEAEDAYLDQDFEDRISGYDEF